MPTVSIIIPCYNEEKTISLLLEALKEQTYPIERTEIIIIDGMSEDNTRENIQDFQNKNSKLKVLVIDNEERKIPHALNIGIEAAEGEIIVRLDAHSIPHPNYIELCVQDLMAGKGANVGGVWEIQPGSNSWIAKGIAVAAGHPIGVGDAKYRFTTTSQYVDTVPFGSYYKNTLVALNGFDETMVANEDYDLNARIISSGEKIWLNANIRANYFARPTFDSLAMQYWRYGFWKVKMLRRFPATLRARQAIPPLFVLALLFGNVIPILRLPYLFGVVIYGIILLSVGVTEAIKKNEFTNIIAVPLAIFTMHICWGSAFLWSLILEVSKGFRITK